MIAILMEIILLWFLFCWFFSGHWLWETFICGLLCSGKTYTDPHLISRLDRSLSYSGQTGFPTATHSPAHWLSWLQSSRQTSFVSGILPVLWLPCTVTFIYWSVLAFFFLSPHSEQKWQSILPQNLEVKECTEGKWSKPGCSQGSHLPPMVYEELTMQSKCQILLLWTLDKFSS